MKAGVGATAKAIAAAASNVGVDLTPTQVSNYFDGRNGPSRNVLNPLAERLGRPEIRIVSEWPWKLLTPRRLTLKEIELICAPPYKTMFQLSNDLPASFNRRERSRWHKPKRFCVVGNCLLKPELPEVFWLQVAHLRAALALKDYESFNAHFIAAVKTLPSIARHRAVWPHVRLFLTCVGMLLEHVDSHYRWFRVNWDVVALHLATETYGSGVEDEGSTMRMREEIEGRALWHVVPCNQLFVDIFSGNSSGVDLEYGFHNLNPFHPENFAKDRRSKP